MLFRKCFVVCFPLFCVQYTLYVIHISTNRAEFGVYLISEQFSLSSLSVLCGPVKTLASPFQKQKWRHWVLRPRVRAQRSGNGTSSFWFYAFRGFKFFPEQGFRFRYLPNAAKKIRLRDGRNTLRWRDDRIENLWKQKPKNVHAQGRHVFALDVNILPIL